MIQLFKYFVCSVGLISTSVANMNAQYFTYNHDDAKMNQITVMETGAGSLTPETYYWLFHNSYKNSAAEKNKTSFRTIASIAGYQQVENADSVKASLKKRAEVEVLNMADRQIDIAWLVESSKVNNKLQDFSNNINRIITAGGSSNDKDRWTQYYNMFQCAIKATQDAYMPNSERKKQYISIYNDLCKENEALVTYIVRLSNKNKTAELLSATYSKPDKRKEITTAAHNRWREAGWKTKSSNANSGNTVDDSTNTINE